MPDTPPPTRREEQRGRTRVDLLDAAATVFAAHGFHGASVDQVAEHAGYTKGAVYSNFSSKAELFLALLDREVDRTVDALETLVTDVPADERAARLADDAGLLPVLGGDWFLLEAEFLLYAARAGDDEVRARVAARQRRTLGRITALVERHLDDLGVDDPPIAPADVARILVASADGFAQAALADGELADAGRLFATLLGALQRPVDLDG